MEVIDPSQPTTELAPLPRATNWRPLLPRQVLIWADDRLRPGNLYHQSVLWVRLAGHLDLERFTAAWDATTKAHDALSVIIDTRSAYQRFAVRLPELGVKVLAPSYSIERWIREQISQEYTPCRQPWEATLLQGPEGSFDFVFRAHHLVCDEKSFAIIVAELNNRYESRKVFPSAQFQDLVHIGQSFTDTSESELQAWKALLADPPPIVAPLGCTEQSDDISVNRIVQWLELPLQAKLKQLAADQRVLTSPDDSWRDVLFCAVTFAWLHAVSGQQDIVISFALDLRTDSTAQAVGPLSELFFLRVQFHKNDTLLSLMDKVRQGQVFAGEHAHASFGDPGCVSAHFATSTRWPQRFCGGPASFHFGDAPVFAAAGLGRGDGRDRVAIRLVTSGEQCGVVFDFSNAAFPEVIQKRLIGFFVNILSVLLDHPREHLAELNWLPADESAQLIQIGQGRQPPKAPDLLEQFANCVQTSPNTIAAEFQDNSLTYGALDRLTNRLARRFQAFGVGSESRVAVAMPRGFGELAALLATLKARGAYVPIDSNHPPDRIRIILEDASPEVLVAPSSSPLAKIAPAGCKLCAFDNLDADLEAFSDEPLGSACQNDDQLAYILFTSGSTGRPKGVEITRAAFANFLQSMAHEPGVTSSDRVLAITTTTFDIAGLELFLPLYVGATIVIADKDTATDPDQLRQLVERSSISVMQATPATWRLLLDTGWTGHDKLRMLCGGEAMSLALAQRLVKCGAELWNMYGPTETTVWSTLERIEPSVKKITIGHAIDHTQLTLRDSDQHLVAPGAIGEICIAGKGLARGYRGRPDLTAERFCVDSSTGERYYRTGDLGRYMAEGKLECLGRVDHQVKIRGFRIEPADIEAQLRSVSGVREVVVVAQIVGQQEPQLVAYWVGSALREQLHSAAKANLPQYMVPSAYIQLDSFPLTTSGKIDRKKLPLAARSNEDSHGSNYTAPRNDKESIVAALMKEVLGVDSVSIDADFFSMGGTSIRAVQLRARIAETMGTNLPLRALFDTPTVLGIVEHLNGDASADEPIVTWLKQGTGRPPWIGLMGINLFEDIARALPDDQPFLAIHVPARYIPGREPFPSVVDLARKYAAVIKKYQPSGPYYFVGLCHGGIVAFEAAAQLGNSGDEIGAIALLDAELPIARHIRRGPRARALLGKLLADPGHFAHRVVTVLNQRIRRARSKPFKRIRQDSYPGEPLDMPFDGPEIEQELSTYEALRHRSRGHLITFRATLSNAQPWTIVDHDLGWKGRADRLSSYDVPSSHLGIVLDSAATFVASKLDEHKRKNET